MLKEKEGKGNGGHRYCWHRRCSSCCPKGKGKGKVGGSQRSKANDMCIHCHEKGYWKRECPQLLSNPDMFMVEVNMISNFASWVLDTGYGAHICDDLQVLQRSRRLSKDEMILRLGDGKVVAAEAVGSLRLSEGKDDQKPFVGQSAIANGLLDLVHTDVCAPLCISAIGGFSYFITFTDIHSRYGYIYLMRYKFEAFGRFKEYRLEVESQTNHKIKAHWSDRGGEYLSGEFIDYLKDNGILSQWTPSGTLQLNRLAERRNGTLLDMVQSMMSFIELPPSFLGYALETATKLLNIAPSKSVLQTPYEIWHCKPASYKYLRVWDSPAYVKRLVGDKLDSRSSLYKLIGYPKETAGYYFYDPAEQKIFVSKNAVFLEKGFPSDNRRDEVLIEKSSGEPHHDSTTSFEPTVHTDGVPVLRRSTRESRVPERYGFVGLTSQLDNDPKTYGEAMSDIDSNKWLEAMKSKMDSMGSNQVWTLVDPPKGVRPAGCKCVYKPKLGADGEVTAFKARLVTKGYTQQPGVDFEETYLPVAMAKSIRIQLAITAWYDCEIW
ncbi:UNVERIFIED_CONTAM: putative mitochondrial protein [Sesamum radiatum]|uniref:Mitochondrial protein n=1 Tax=Sesamum radiatum TaxID=300843 RepID=A0AAW2JHW7_SESRA